MTDINNLIADNIDIWSNAVQFGSTSGRGKSKKLTLHGIKKLRDLILELAVHGKLVPQLPSEEPASMLLERLANDKSKLVKEKLIKKPKNLPELTNEDLPFKVPGSWTWCRLQDISSYIQRGKGPKYDELGKVKVISQKCIQWPGFDIEPARFVNDESLEKYQDERYLQPNDLLWNSTGTGTVGRINVLDEVKEKTLVADSHVTVIRSLLLNPHFIWVYISAPGIQARIEPEHENALVSGSTKQVELNTSSVVALEIPLPPEEEQNRIVEKVKELMALCDQLEQQTEVSIDAHQLLVEELLSTLTNSENTQEFEQNWARIAEHFDLLFTTEYSIEQLKQTILQLAVMGKLVPQDPTDEPASKLLERIAQEKEQKIKSKIFKKQKPTSPVVAEEKIFTLPKNWRWCKLAEVSQLKGGFAYKSGKFVPESNFQVIRMGNIRPDYLRINEKPVFIDSGLAEDTEQYKILKGEVLLTMTGTKGKKDYLYSVAIKEEHLANQKLYLNQRLCAVHPVQIKSQFLSIALKDSRLLESIYAKSTGTANQANIGMEAISNWVIPLPPINEQLRIVGKVLRLLALCEQAKLDIEKAEQTKISLANAIVERALA